MSWRERISRVLVALKGGTVADDEQAVEESDGEKAHDEESGDGNSDGKAKDLREGKSSDVPAPNAPGASGAAGNPHGPAMDRLRALAAGLLTIGGAIATVLVAGSQLADLGSLDTTDRVELFGWHQTRFEFAVIGLGVALGSIAVAVTIAIWVQTTAHVTLEKLCSYPVEPKARMLEWRVRAKVRQAIERELERRGVNAEDDKRVEVVATRWREARSKEQQVRQAHLALDDALQKLRVPALSSGEAASVTDWTNPTQLVDLAKRLNEDPPASEPDEKAVSALAALESQMKAAYANSRSETRQTFRLVTRVIQDASYLRLNMSFSMTLKYIVLAFIAAGVGIAMFAWAANPPETSTTRSPTVVQLPINASVDDITFEGCDAATLVITPVAEQGFTYVSAAASAEDGVCVISTES